MCSTRADVDEELYQDNLGFTRIGNLIFSVSPVEARPYCLIKSELMIILLTMANLANANH